MVCVGFMVMVCVGLVMMVCNQRQGNKQSLFGFVIVRLVSISPWPSAPQSRAVIECVHVLFAVALYV